MRFKAETDLIKVIKQEILSVYSRTNIEIFEEISLGFGIADIVICDSKVSSQKQRIGVPALNRTDANIYQIIHKSKTASFDVIYDTTRCSKKSISLSLNKLIRHKYIEQVNDYFTINQEYKFPYNNAFAIEAKLRDWKRALNQAHRYKWFAEYAFVVLDAHYAQPAIKNLDLFKRYNVGLVTLSPDGSFTRHFKPIKQKPYDPIMQILLSEKLKAIKH